MEKVNKGAIFKNKQKTNEKHPDYRGKINWGGTDIEVSMWVNEAKSGEKYFAVSLQEPYNKDNVTTTLKNTSEKLQDLNDGLPF
jgi:uncharacterized protein (DUF736 family)